MKLELDVSTELTNFFDLKFHFNKSELAEKYENQTFPSFYCQK